MIFNKLTHSAVLCYLLSLITFKNSNAQEIWSPAYAHNQYQLNTTALQQLLTKDNFQLSLPSPDGTFEVFKFKYTPVFAPELQQKFPEIKTYTGIQHSNQYITAKMTIFGDVIDVYVFNNSKTFIIQQKDHIYTSFYKQEATKSSSFECLLDEKPSSLESQDVIPLPMGILSGEEKKKYRLALACTYEYAVAVTGTTTPTKPQVLAAMTTTINRVNGIYERELGATLEFIPNNDALIWTTNSSAVFDNNNPYSLILQNSNFINSTIGSNNFDIGHIFSTGGGGLATLACICSNNKAEGVTGTSNPQGDPYDVDYVSHEMGHQLGADHSFNKCINEVARSAFEPGSGSTIMGYAGICGIENIQGYSDDYFHAFSKYQINTWLTDPINTTCGVNLGSGITVPVFDLGAEEYYIPANTPFELEAPVVGADKYNWLQWDLGNFRGGQQNSASFTNGPTFRSYHPTTSRERIFPRLDSILINHLSYNGERLPNVSRTLHFIVDAIAMDNNWGSSRTSEDTLLVHTVSGGNPFRIIHPNNPVILLKNNTFDITWDVGRTRNAPISCDEVNIFLSRDGGYTFTDTIALNVSNNGLYKYLVPDSLPKLNTYRMKIKCSDNIFFDISKNNFAIDTFLSIKEYMMDTKSAFGIYPNPSFDILNIENKKEGQFIYSVFNISGRKLLEIQSENAVNQIDISTLQAGNYFLYIINPQTQEQYRYIFTKSEH